MADEKSLYEILEIPAGSKDIAVKRAYRRLSFKYHPDTREQGLSSDKNREYDHALAEIRGAYEVLSDPEMKSAYDAVFEVLEEQKTVSWNDPYSNTGMWNMPQGRPTPYAPFTSGSASTVYTGQYTSGSSSPFSFASSSWMTFSVRIDDVVAAGLTGLVSGQIVYIYYGTTSPIGMTLSAPPAQSSGSCMKCRIISARYGNAPGLPVYGDFQLEEI